MDCGIPFCHHGCPLGNLIPEWNDLVRRDDWREADRAAARDQQLPGVHREAVPGAVRGLLRAEPAPSRRSRSSRSRWRSSTGPSPRAGSQPQPAAGAHRQEGRRRRLRPGRAGRRPAAHPGRARGHRLRAGRPRSAGCSATASPSSRWRSASSTGGWTRCAPRAPGSSPASRSAATGATTCRSSSCAAEFDAVVLAGGATVGRDLPAPGRELAGIHLAMEFLPYGNLQALGELDSPPIDAAGKHVVIIGGGDTGADCLGTSHRQGAASVDAAGDHARAAGPPGPRRTRGRPTRWSCGSPRPTRRAASGSTRSTPSGSGRRGRPATCGRCCVHEVELVDGRFQKVEGTERELPADLVFLAMGFTGAQREGLVDGLGVEVDGRGNVVRDAEFMSTVPGVFVAGDIGRGQSLIVWAIAEGRAAAGAVDTLADRLLDAAPADHPDGGRTALRQPPVPPAPTSAPHAAGPCGGAELRQTSTRAAPSRPAPGRLGPALAWRPCPVAPRSSAPWAPPSAPRSRSPPSSSPAWTSPG